MNRSAAIVWLLAWTPAAAQPLGNLIYQVARGLFSRILASEVTDVQPVPAEANRLSDQVLVRYYEREGKGIAR